MMSLSSDIGTPNRYHGEHTCARATNEVLRAHLHGGGRLHRATSRVPSTAPRARSSGGGAGGAAARRCPRGSGRCGRAGVSRGGSRRRRGVRTGGPVREERPGLELVRARVDGRDWGGLRGGAVAAELL